MKSVFLGGSRKVSRLNDVIRKRLRELMRRDMQIVVGDANGADRALQRQLAEWAYPHVVVYFVGMRPRNNVGEWPTYQVATPHRARGFEYYAQKDREMARHAECGMMLWDGQSRGTLANVENLVRHGKPVIVYLSPRKRFVNIMSERDLASLDAIPGGASKRSGARAPLDHEQTALELPTVEALRRKRGTRA